MNPLNYTHREYGKTAQARPNSLSSVNSDRACACDWIKPLIDVTVGLVLFILAMPVMLLAGLLVKATSSGPILYSQTRVGRSGRPFQIYKIRTMFHNSEAAGARWCAKADPRITFIGRILRKTHIDELPQLWNILRGDMSLVGPRPERPEFVPVLEKSIEGYLGRLAVKPGLTGLAQIQLPPDTNLESVRKKLALDLAYIQKRSLWLDFRLCIGTALYLFGCSYSTVRRLMNLPNRSASPAAINVVDQTVSPHTHAVPTAVLVEMMPSETQATPEFSSV